MRKTVQTVDYRCRHLCLRSREVHSRQHPLCPTTWSKQQNMPTVVWVIKSGICNYCNKNARFFWEFARIVVPLHRNWETKPPMVKFLMRYGQVPEWPNGADCKSAGLRLRWFESILAHLHITCGSSSVDRALAFQAEGRGFESRLPLFFSPQNSKTCTNNFPLIFC